MAPQLITSRSQLMTSASLPTQLVQQSMFHLTLPLPPSGTLTTGGTPHSALRPVWTVPCVLSSSFTQVRLVFRWTTHSGQLHGSRHAARRLWLPRECVQYQTACSPDHAERLDAYLSIMTTWTKHKSADLNRAGYGAGQHSGGWVHRRCYLPGLHVFPGWLPTCLTSVA